MASSKQHHIVCAFAVIVTLGCAGQAWAVEFAGGTGEPNDPYQIATAGQLVAVGSDSALFDKCFILVEDIDLDPNLPGGAVFSHSLIAPYGAQPRRSSDRLMYGRFTGRFDGDGHVIRHLVILSDDVAKAGLFGYVAAPGQIRDLGLEDVEIRPSPGTAAALTLGSLVACNEGGAIAGCYAAGSIAGPGRVQSSTGGGTRVRVADDNEHRIGGLVGVNQGIVNACYSLVDVNGTGVLGGLAGQNEGAILFSFAAGHVEGIGWPGGLVGQSGTGTVSRSYWDTQTSGILDSAGGEGRTSEELMSRRTYGSWVHTGMWTLNDANDYPRLAWEQAPGALIGDGEPGYDGGRGEPGDPYQVRTAGQFMTIGCHPEDFGASFVLTADIDFNSVDCSQMLPIGSPNAAFSGQFDGRSHGLSNLTISRPRDMAVGVFGVVGAPGVSPQSGAIQYDIRDDGSYGWSGGGSRGGTSSSAGDSRISNLHLDNVTVVGREYVGGLIGYGSTAVSGCAVSGQVTGLLMVGGLAGCLAGGTASGCRTDVQVGGEFGVGGLIGGTWSGRGSEVRDCLAAGGVTGLLQTGGLIGSSQSDTISRCGAVADVQGRYIAGGFVGYMQDSKITASYSVCTVAAEQPAGGFVGHIRRGTVSDSYSRADVTGVRQLGGFSGYCRLEKVARCYAVSTVTALDPTVPYLRLGAFTGIVPTISSECTGECPMDFSNCFWDTEVSGLTDATGNRPTDAGSVAGLSTAQMQAAATFTDAGWDFVDTWMICEGKDYPRLKWENAECPQ